MRINNFDPDPAISLYMTIFLKLSLKVWKLLRKNWVKFFSPDQSLQNFESGSELIDFGSRNLLFLQLLFILFIITYLVFVNYINYAQKGAA